MKHILTGMAITVIALTACNSDTSKTTETQNTKTDSAATAPTATPVYACPMHPEVTGKKGDKCPKCGMDLKEVKDGTSAPGTSTNSDTKGTVSVKGIVDNYLQLKNAFTKDNSKDAATAGTALQNGFKNFDKAALSAAQKKTFEDIADDANEHAEHIANNGGKIAHQREHFEMLSKDMYDLVKAFGGGQSLYKDFCPMYNNNKGAFWISETKEIKNPYLGKAMPTCGVVKEEIK